MNRVLGGLLTRGYSIPNRAKRGLYHGKGIKTGEYRTKTNAVVKRRWLPNVHPAAYWSDLLGRKIHLRMTTKARRCIDKAAGFDNYILYTKPDLLGGEGSVGVALQLQMKRIVLEQKLRTEADYQATHFGGDADELYTEKIAALEPPVIDPATPVTERELKLREKVQKQCGRRLMQFKRRTPKGTVRIRNRKPHGRISMNLTANWAK